VLARRPGPVLLAGVAVLAAALSSCGPGRVRADPPRPDTRAAAACADLHAALPGKLDGHPRREVRPGSDLTAAWGDPPIVLRCGVGVPGAYRPTSQLYTVNDVDWLPERLSKGYVFTTVGRAAGVELTVPDRYSPENNPVADMSLLVARQVPVSATPSSAPAPTR
jgi:hypothetical protein